MSMALIYAYPKFTDKLRLATEYNIPIGYSVSAANFIQVNFSPGIKH